MSQTADPTNLIGRPIPRLEDRRLLIGQGRFTDDDAIPGSLHAQFVRSPYPHAHIRGIDTDIAVTVPGVLGILTAADYRRDGNGPIAHRPNPADAVDHTRRAFGDGCFVDIPHWPLSESQARYLGEPVAVVLAETAQAAKNAVEAVIVDYAPLEAVVDAEDALDERAPLLWPEAPSNLCVEQVFGDQLAVTQRLKDSYHVVRRRFHHGRIVNSQMEPRSIVVIPDPESGKLVVSTGSQGALRIRDGLCQALGMAPENLRVVSRDVGGGFGPRSFVYPEMAVVAWAARRLGRPVKWTADRSESFLADYQGRDTSIEAALGLDVDGRFLALEVDIVSNIGAHTVAFVPLANASRIATTTYDIPAASVRARGVMTTTVPTVPYRGAGRPEATAALEQLIDLAAAEMGIDRLKLRECNLIPGTRVPYTNALGLTYDSGRFSENFARAATLADWHNVQERRRRAEGRGRLLGIGIANYVESPVGDPREQVCLDVSPEGFVTLTTGTHSTGQGHETTLAQVAASRLQVPLESIRFRSGDSDVVLMGGGTHSDRSMRIAGTLLHEAGVEIVATARNICCHLWNRHANEIPFDQGVFRDPASNETLNLFDVATLMLEQDRGTLQSTRSFVGRMPAHPTGAAVCELEIDPETGGFDITRYTSVDDAGQVINPLILHGQVHGGIVQGIGEALIERLNHDAESGQLLTGSFVDYALPRADQIPSLTVELLEDRTENNPLGVKGGGEAGITPAAAAIGNALADALSPFNPPPIRFPVTQEWIWQVIQKGQT